MATRTSPDAGVRLIVLYKLVKAGSQLALAALLAAVLASGARSPVDELADAVRRHATAAWSLRVAGLLGRAGTSHGTEVTIAALASDGLLTLGEGWALRRGFAWAPWLVVVSTGSLLPFEVVELGRRPGAPRLVLLVVNVAIVLYLVVRARRERRSRRAERA